MVGGAAVPGLTLQEYFKLFLRPLRTEIQLTYGINKGGMGRGV